MANDNNETQEQQGIQFEDIQPWYDNSGDTGLSARLKLKRNFDKIKAVIDAISSLPSLIRNYLSRVNDDTAEGEITFKKGIKTGQFRSLSPSSGAAIDSQGNAELESIYNRSLISTKEGIVIGQFRSRFLGSGAAVDSAGNAEFESIYSRSFISAPEFVFNRIKVTEGEIWCTNGYGDIEDVKEGEDENGDVVVNGGLITLHLDENDYASVQVGDICRGIYNDIAGAYETATVDDDVQMAAGSSSQEGDGIGFSAKKGFFTSYFYIERMVINRKGECQFIYKLRSAATPHPCAFMKFAQYGSFTNAERRASKYESSINHYYKMILEGVSTWQIQSANIVSRSGYLGDMEVELADHTTRRLQGYGLYVQNNVYFGSAVVQLDPYTLEMLERDLAQYDVNLGEHVDMIVVDDTGNVIGGVYTETTEGGVTTREYRIHSVITVRKKNVLLTEAMADAEAGTGTYKISFTPVGCTAMIENSTLYITGIDHVKDGVAGSGDDANFDYDAMRAVDSCRIDLVIDCEGVTSVQKSIPIVVKHDSQPYVGADISNQFSGVSWNTKTQAYIGLPITFNFKMWHNDEVLDIVSANDVSVTLADGTAIPDTWTYAKTIMTVSGNKIAYISISELPADLGSVTDLRVTCSAVYSGVRYERTLVHTINKSTDTNVYSLIPSVDEVIVNKNTGALSSNSVDISVVCDSSDNKHYDVAYNQFSTHQLCICYKKFYTDGSSDANETEYTGTAVSINSGVERVSFYLYKKVGNTIDRTVLHDKEDVPVIANGLDGKGVEYIFITKADWDGTDEDKPTIYDVAEDRQVDNYCPYTDAQHTDQWTDEPTGVASNARVEFYAQRKKINGVWQPFGDVYFWDRYVVDGVTPYVIDLSNEQSMVACNESGGVVGSYETSKLMLFYGQSYAFTDFAITITPTNITCNNSAVAFTLTAEQKAAAQNDGYFTLTPSAITQDSATIAITATKGNIVLNAVYKVNKAYAGKNGVIYSLMSSLDTIRKNKSGELVDQTLTLQVKKTVGAEATILTTAAKLSEEGLTLKYENASTESPVTITDAVSIATNTFVGTNGTWGKIILIKSNVIVDAERINVVSDGVDGQSSLIADLTNEMDSVAMDVSGNVLSQTTLTTTFKIYYGSTAQTLTSLTSSGAATGVTVSCDATTGIVTIVVAANTTLTNDKNVITLTGVCAKRTRTAEFTISGVRSGNNGVTPTLFNILPFVDSIKRDKDNTLTPTSITCTVQKVHGTTVSAAAAGDGTLRYNVDGDITASDQGTELALGGTVNYTSSNSYITFAYFVGGVMRDKERVPIVYDGADGDDAAEVYVSPGSITVPCNNSGSVVAQMQQRLSLSMYVGNKVATISSVTATCPTGVSVAAQGTSTKDVTITTSATADGMATGIVFTVVGTVDSKEYTATATVPLIGSKQGGDGYGIVLTLTRDNYNEANWASVVGANKNFNYSGDVTVRAGDYFIVEGVSTDKGLRHEAKFKCTNQTASIIYGDCISHISDGATGDAGPMYYPAGIHDPNAPYEVTSSLVPIVCSGASYYYAKKTVLADQNIPVTNTEYWGAFSNFAAVFTEILFASFSKLGSFIISGDWFISQYGTLYSASGTAVSVTSTRTQGSVYLKDVTMYGSTKKVPYYAATNDASADMPCYTYFKDDDPRVEGYGISSYPKFRPILAIDALTGDSVLGNTYVEGTVKATNLYHGVCVNGAEEWVYVSYETDATIELGWAVGTYHQSSALPDGTIRCTYSADVVICPNLYNNTNQRTITLPKASDFQGKMVEVYDCAYTNSQYPVGDIGVVSVDNNGPDAGLYKRNGIITWSGAGGGYIVAGNRGKFISAFAENKWKWLKLS